MPRGKLLIVIALFCLAACQVEQPPVLPTLFVLETTTPVIPAIETETRPLLFWQPVTGLLSADRVERWQFEGKTGDKITLRAIGRGSEPVLMLLDANGKSIQQGQSIETELPTGGIYQVEVSSTGSGDYELGLAYTGQTNPAEVLPTPIPQVVGVPTPVPVYANLGTFISELRHGETKRGIFPETETRHVYTFNGERGRYITAIVNKVTGERDPLILLFNPEGEPVALDGGSAAHGDAVLRNILLPEDGIYTFQVSGQAVGYTLTFYDNDQFSPVTPTVIAVPSATPAIPVLTPTIAAAVPGMSLEDHVAVMGELTRKGDVAVYAFSTLENELLTIGVIPLGDSALIPRIEIIDPEGIPVAAVSGTASPNTREALISPFIPALPGNYSIFVTGEGETFGEYLISYGVGTTRQSVMRGQALADTTYLGVIPPGGVRDIWHVYLRKDDLITVTLNTQQGALNPVMDIVSEDGMLIGIDNNSGGERTPLISGVRIPETGLYYIRVRPAVSGTIGPYALIWRYLAAGATATPPEGTLPILTIRDEVEENAYQFYPFQGRAGQVVRVRVTAALDSTLDPVLALLDVDGQSLAESDDFEGNLNPRLETTLPADGTYTVRVNGYLSSGAFEVIVEEVFR